MSETESGRATVESVLDESVLVSEAASSRAGQQPRWLPRNRWAIVGLMVVTFGVPMLEPAIVNSVQAYLSDASGLTTAAHLAILHACWGLAAALRISPGFAVLAMLSLWDAALLKRLGVLLIFLAVHLMIGGLYLIWMRTTGQFAGAPSVSRLMLYLLSAPALAMVAYAFAGVMRWFARWTIVRGQTTGGSAAASVGMMMEWLLISSLGFLFLQRWVRVQYPHATLPLFYDFVFHGLPAIGLAVVSCLLVKLILSRNRFGRAAVLIAAIAIVHCVSVLTVVGLLRWDQTLGLSQDLAVSLDALAKLVTGTVVVAAMFFCLRRLGFRLLTRRDAVPID
jgi:hypothetical protein